MKLPIVALALLATLVAAGTATAATVAKDGDATVRFSAAPGERNDPLITLSNGAIVTTAAPPLEPGAGCLRGETSSPTAVTIFCSAEGVTRVNAVLGDGDDSVGLSLPPAGPGATVEGGDGVDSIVYTNVVPVAISFNGLPDDGPAGRGDNVGADVENATGTLADGDVLTGSDAANRLNPEAGQDTVNGGGGDDFVDTRDFADCESEGDCSRADRDVVTCGAGSDIVDADFFDEVAGDCELVARSNRIDLGNADNAFTGFRPGLTIAGRGGDDRITGRGADTLVGNSGNDVLRAAGSNNVLTGSSGNDRLFGSNGVDYMAGGYGNDVVRGASGKDEIYGGAGRDRVYGGARNDLIVIKDRGAQRDRAYCGSGRDIVVVDSRDFAGRDCERVTGRLPKRR